MLGKRILEQRTSLGWSQVELAKRLNVAKQTVSNWENDNIQPSIEMLLCLARLFHVSTDYLLGLESSTKLDVEGLPIAFVGHLSLLIEDYRQLQNKSNEHYLE